MVVRWGCFDFRRKYQATNQSTNFGISLIFCQSVQKLKKLKRNERVHNMRISTEAVTGNTNIPFGSVLTCLSWMLSHGSLSHLIYWGLMWFAIWSLRIVVTSLPSYQPRQYMIKCQLVLTLSLCTQKINNTSLLSLLLANWIPTLNLFTNFFNPPLLLHFSPKFKSLLHQTEHTFNFPITTFTLLLFPNRCLYFCSSFCCRFPGTDGEFQIIWLKLRFPLFIYYFCVVYLPLLTILFLTYYRQALIVCLLQASEVMLLSQEILTCTTTSGNYTPLILWSWEREAVRFAVVNSWSHLTDLPTRTSDRIGHCAQSS